MSVIPAGIIEGRNIHYVAYNGRHLAGMITGVPDAQTGEPAAGTIDPVLFTNLRTVHGNKSAGVQFHWDVPHSDRYEPGTWHFIER
jgi:hypothetical protein